MEKLFLRRAEPQDIDIFYAWRNEETTRKNSFSKDWVNYSEHRAWFIAALNNPAEEMWVLCNDEDRLGQIRLSHKDESYYLTYSVAREYRGQGYGKILLRLVENEICQREPKQKIVAHVKNDNVASQMVFRSLKYDEKILADCRRFEKFPSYESVPLRAIPNGGG